MKNYSFEYDDDKLKIKLFLISFLLFFVLFFGLMFLKFLNFFFLISISLGIPILIILANIKRIKKSGIAEIENEKIKFNFEGIEKEINFTDIKSYFINSNNGSSLTLKLKNGKMYGVISNRYFSNPIRFTQVCHTFETEFEKYNTVNNIELKREKSFFEQAWIFPFLIIFTIIIILLVVFAIYKGVNFTASFFGAIGTLATIWSGYLSGKRKTNEKNSWK